MPRKYQFDWDEDLGGLTPEQVVADCRRAGQTFETFAEEYATGEFVQGWRQDSPYCDMTDEQWQDYLTQFRAWLVAQLRRAARGTAKALGKRIERDDPRCRVTGIRRHESGFCELEVVDTRTGIPFLVRDLEDWQVRLAQSTPAPAPAMLTVAEVADRLRLDPETIVRRIKAGELRAHKIGGIYRIPADALEEYLRRTEVKVPATEEFDAAKVQGQVARLVAELTETAPRFCPLASGSALLATPLDQIDSRDVPLALGYAHLAGIAAAKADRGAAGGIDQPTADARDYYSRVVEECFRANAIGAYTLNEWRDGKFDADPRVTAFCDAWKADMAEAAEQLAKMEAEVAEGVRHEKETRKRGPDA